MRYMQIVNARHLEEARASYLLMLRQHGVALVPGMQIHTETVHRGLDAPRDAWLCYVAMPSQQAA